MTNLKTHLGVGITALSLLIAGCGGGGSGPSDPRIPAENTSSNNSGDDSSVGGDQETFCTSESTAFEVAEFVPADGEQGVELNRSIRVTFNAEVDEASVSQNSLPLTVNGNATLVPATYNTLGKTVVINPDGSLLANTDYQIAATTDLRALCDGEGDLVKNMVENDSSAFKTGDQMDSQGPSAVASSPEDGETLAPVDSNIYVEFDEEINPRSVTASNFTVTEIDENGNPVATIEGVINPVGNSIEFDPDANLDWQAYYEITVDTTITDLAGNALVQPETYTFRTGGLVVMLDNTLLAQTAGSGFDSGILVDGLHTLGGTLLSTLEFSDSEDGLNGVDNALILQIPLVEDLLTGALYGGDITTLNGTDFTEYSSVLVAVCNPKSVTTTDPSADCVLGLDLGLDATQLQSLADAFTGGNPEQIPALIQAMAETLASGDFNNLPQELSDALGGQLFPTDDGLGVEFRLVDDSSIPLPAQAEDALLMVLEGFNTIPLVGDLFTVDDGKSLVDLGLLEGSLLGVDLGGLASLDVLSGTETIIGEKGVLNLGGSLFDLLLEHSGPGGDVPLSPEDLPLIGDLLNLEDISLDPARLQELADLLELPEGFEFDPATLPLVGDILAALPDDFPGGFPDGGADQLPLLGDLILLLDPSNLDGEQLTSIPVLGDLVEELLALSVGETDPLPLVDELTKLLDGDELGDDSPLGPLTDLLNPDQLSDTSVLNDLLGLLGLLEL